MSMETAESFGKIDKKILDVLHFMYEDKGATIYYFFLAGHYAFHDSNGKRIAEISSQTFLDLESRGFISHRKPIKGGEELFVSHNKCDPYAITKKGREIVVNFNKRN